MAKAEEEGLPGQECAWERAQPARLPEEARRDAKSIKLEMIKETLQ